MLGDISHKSFLPEVLFIISLVLFECFVSTFIIQDHFEIFDEGEIGTDFIEWLYNTRTTDFDTLPENTSLQRNMKKHILSGGIVRNAYGRLK